MDYGESMNQKNNMQEFFKVMKIIRNCVDKIINNLTKITTEGLKKVEIILGKWKKRGALSGFLKEGVTPTTPKEVPPQIIPLIRYDTFQ